jgi:hypothetical protein
VNSLIANGGVISKKVTTTASFLTLDTAHN